MNNKLIEISRQMKTKSVYEIYKFCMYKPTYKKYTDRINLILQNKNIKCYGCFQNEILSGIAVIFLCGDDCAEIIGIAVSKKFRNKKIGSFIINEIANMHSLKKIIAKTDKESVGFYKKCGFDTRKFTHTYKNKIVDRYECVLFSRGEFYENRNCERK